VPKHNGSWKVTKRRKGEMNMNYPITEARELENSENRKNDAEQSLRALIGGNVGVIKGLCLAAGVLPANLKSFRFPENIVRSKNSDKT
jgi:hypothetical protein